MNEEEFDITNMNHAQDIPDSRDFTTEELFGSPVYAGMPEFASVDFVPFLNQGSSGACHDENTEVLTRFGWRFFKDLSDNDELATVNPKTQKLYFEVPKTLISYHFEGNLVVGKRIGLDFAVTPNHQMLVRKWEENNRKLSKDYQFVEASKLGWYSGLLSRVKNTIENSDVFVLKGIENATCGEQRNDKIVDMKEWLKFLGIFIADGTLCYNEKRKQYKIQIAALKERKRNFIEDLLPNIGIENYCSIKDRFTFNNKRIFNELAPFFLWKKSYEKRVPEYVFQEGEENIKAFLEGHFNGDGGFSSGGRKHYTSSKGLAEDLQRLIFLSGEEALIKERSLGKGGIIRGRQIFQRRPSYIISVREKINSSICFKEHVSEKFYSGKVYCAEVSSFHTLVTRRNGCILISGNCTVFGSAGALFNTMSFDAKHSWGTYIQPYNPWDVWDRALALGANNQTGWTLQGAMKLQKDLGYSIGYANVGAWGLSNVNALKYWLWKGRAITTGTTFGNWRDIITTEIYSESNVRAGHIFHFSMYDDNRVIGTEKGGFYSPNSWGGRGKFWFPYSQASKLFTQYIALGPADLKELTNLRNERTQQALIKSKDCWNHKSGSVVATAFELATMVNRGLNFLGNQKRKQYADIFSEKIIRDNGIVRLWNEKSPSQIASDLEIAIMFTNAVTRTSWTGLKLTRLQVATVIGRDLILQ